MPNERLSQHPASWIRTAVAANVYTAPDLLRTLCRDKNISVRLAAAFNTSCPIDCLNELAESDDWESRLGLVTQLDLCEEILLALTNHRNPYLVKQARLAVTALELEQRLEKIQMLNDRGDKFKLGMLLVDAKIIELKDLSAALELSSRHNIKIGRTLLQVGLVSSDMLFRALSLQSQLRNREIAREEALMALIANSAEK
ncbi:MAG: hypothetical protein JST89_14775 [Cyanobacteria bacterium SZAS-4]|nr:hypothetical protein [Cyanobacteria bacterium SZAS-4]